MTLQYKVPNSMGADRMKYKDGQDCKIDVQARRFFLETKPKHSF